MSLFLQSRLYAAVGRAFSGWGSIPPYGIWQWIIFKITLINPNKKKKNQIEDDEM
jgi:hypothetical protein